MILKWPLNITYKYENKKKRIEDVLSSALIKLVLTSVYHWESRHSSKGSGWVGSSVASSGSRAVCIHHLLLHFHLLTQHRLLLLEHLLVHWHLVYAIELLVEHHLLRGDRITVIVCSWGHRRHTGHHAAENCLLLSFLSCGGVLFFFLGLLSIGLFLFFNVLFLRGDRLHSEILKMLFQCLHLKWLVIWSNFISHSHKLRYCACAVTGRRFVHYASPSKDLIFLPSVKIPPLLFTIVIFCSFDPIILLTGTNSVSCVRNSFWELDLGCDWLLIQSIFLYFFDDLSSRSEVKRLTLFDQWHQSIHLSLDLLIGQLASAPSSFELHILQAKLVASVSDSIRFHLWSFVAAPINLVADHNDGFIDLVRSEHLLGLSVCQIDPIIA